MQVSNLKRLDYRVYPSEDETIQVVDDPIYGGAHLYLISNTAGFENGKPQPGLGYQTIQFVEKNDSGEVLHGLQSEQVAYVLLDRAIKLNKRFPSAHNEKQIVGLRMFLAGCEDRVRERIERGVMGKLEK